MRKYRIVEPSFAPYPARMYRDVTWAEGSPGDVNQRPATEPDRRRHARIEPKGTVTIHALGNAHRGRIVNISAGGLYIATDIGLPDRLLGRVVDLELTFDGASWQRLSGRISRISACGAAIVFVSPMTPALLLVLDALTTPSLPHA